MKVQTSSESTIAARVAGILAGKASAAAMVSASPIGATLEPPAMKS